MGVEMADVAGLQPRPLADREMKWHPVWRALRLEVKPGMTGMWQVRCGSYSDFADWISYDVQYIQNACLSLDLWILIKTVGADRCLFGTERPGIGTVKDPRTGRWMDDTRHFIEGFDWLSEEDKHLIFEGNARTVFKLDVQVPA